MLRLADLHAQEQRGLCSLPTIEQRSLEQRPLRLDGHPVWSRDYGKVCFQAAPEGVRQLFVADLSGVI